jgi:hypothetical protein
VKLPPIRWYWKVLIVVVLFLVMNAIFIGFGIGRSVHSAGLAMQRMHNGQST